MAKPFTVQCTYAAYYARTVTVDAQTLDEALNKAIEAANESDAWRALDHCGPTFVDAVCEGADADPWDAETALPIPDRFTERGAPPVVTLAGPGRPGSIEVSGGTVSLRFVDAAGIVTAEVRNGRAHVRILDD